MSTTTTHIETEKRSAERSRGKLIPELRFKEFEKEWNYFKLEDVVMKKISYGIVQAGEHIEGGMPYIKSKDINGPIKLDTLERTSDEIAKKYIRSEVTPGDIIFSLRGNIGISQILPESIKVANLTQGTARISVSNNYANYFVYQSLYTLPVIKRILCVSKGSTFQEISLADLRNVKIVSPALPEQQKIASFLSEVDEKIQQLTKKKELLEQYKKGVMQQLFSGQVRFKDENGNPYPDWEEKLLDDVANIKRGASPRPISDPKWFDTDSEIGWVRISDVTKSNKYLEKTTQYLTAEGVAKSRLVATGSMIMSICATIGKPIYTKFEVCIHDGFVVFENLQADKEFLYYYLDKIQLQWYRYGQPGSQVNLNSTIVGNETMPYPCIEEQQKIATYLSSIDSKIEAVYNQITQTQTFKKGLLQQMFV
jgi:type I restriction enzyme S subunit